MMNFRLSAQLLLSLLVVLLMARQTANYGVLAPPASTSSETTAFDPDPANATSKWLLTFAERLRPRDSRRPVLRAVRLHDANLPPGDSPKPARETKPLLVAVRPQTGLELLSQVELQRRLLALSAIRAM